MSLIISTGWVSSALLGHKLFKIDHVQKRVEIKIGATNSNEIFTWSHMPEKPFSGNQKPERYFLKFFTWMEIYLNDQNRLLLSLNKWAWNITFAYPRKCKTNTLQSLIYSSFVTVAAIIVSKKFRIISKWLRCTHSIISRNSHHEFSKILVKF